MRRQASRPQGFTLIEAAVAVGIIAILASAAAPLVMKALNQQRERTTRDGLKIAFEAMFGSRERRVANMRTDFGFTPPMPPAPPGGSVVAMADLRFLTNRNTSPSGTNPRPYPYIPAGVAFNIGWNGPYWSGSVRITGGQSLPADGWGRPIQLIYNGTGYQVRSLGSDGRINTADDLYYPTTFTRLASSTPTVSVVNLSSSTHTLTVRLVSPGYRGGSVVNCEYVDPINHQRSTTATLASGARCIFALPASTTSLPPGIVQAIVSVTSNTALSQSALMELGVGDQQVIPFSITNP